MTHKYHAIPQTIKLRDGFTHKFASTKEANRYKELTILERAGYISDLQIQVAYELIPSQTDGAGKKERSVKYIADFVYTQNGKKIVEDVKGYKQGAAYALYSIKRKLMLEKYGITIKEV